VINVRVILIAVGLTFLFGACAQTKVVQNSTTKNISTSDIALSMQRVADWQIEHFRDVYDLKYAKAPHHILDWTNGALYVGMLKWASISGDPRYQEWLRNIADRGEWKLHSRMYNADDHIVGQLYLDLYRRYNDASMLAKTKESLEYIMANPSSRPISIEDYKNFERWTWCDALFMSPPVWAKLTNITGDDKYLNWMVAEFKATTEHLYDKEEGLYYRDDNFIGKLVHDKKVFWGRGNGWVYAGLTLVLDELDPESVHYPYFKSLYLQMTKTLKSIQTEQGHWSMSLLDGDNYPTPETSGTSFFTYGLAWGINNGLLNKDQYLPNILKAWTTLTSHITEDGMLGYVQPIGAAPGQAWPDRTEVYGTGAFLAAGSEVYKLLGGLLPVTISPSKNLDNAIKISDQALQQEQFE
jgi:rhamnogalacturonyl hydrolase YesR